MDSVFIGCNGKATTLGRSQTFTLGPSAQISTEIDSPWSAHARRTPPSPWRFYKAAWFWALGQLVASHCMRDTYSELAEKHVFAQVSQLALRELRLDFAIGLKP